MSETRFESLQSQIKQISSRINEHAQAIEIGIFRDSQQQQVLDQYRLNIYNLELKFNLLLKILEEKNILCKNEFQNRWPLFLKNDIGILGPNGRMDGSLKVTFYGK